MKYLLTGFTAWLFFLVAVTSLSAQNKNSVQGDLEALTDLYIATTGDSWSNNSGWLKGNPSNKWYGVKVDRNGRVIRLDLYKNNLKGKLPKSIGNLSKLQFFSVKRNPIYSRIPQSIKNWKKAKTVLFSSGSDYNLPHDKTYNDHLGKKYIHSVAKYYGTIPDVFDRMPDLEILEIAWSEDLDGQPFPSTLYQHSNLKVLLLQAVKLTGTLNDSFDLPNLRLFVLGNNFLEGSLPGSIGNFTKLQKIFLSHSDWFASNHATHFFSGTLPSSFSNLINMERFFISNQQIEGEIPGFIVENWSGLREFKIAKNNFTGTIPGEFGDFNLGIFDVSHNNFTGSLDANIVSGMPNVIIFFVRHNNLSGEIPNGEIIDGEFRGWRTKRKLRSVAFDHNNFSGRLPDMPEYVGDMSLLLFHRNNFTGGIPDSWKELYTPALRDVNRKRTFSNLQLRDNNLQGIIPEWFTAENGPTFDIGGNRWSHRDILENNVDVGLSFGTIGASSPKPFGFAVQRQIPEGGQFMYDYSHKVHSRDKVRWSKYNYLTEEWERDARFDDEAMLVIANIKNADYGSYRMELYNEYARLPDWVVSEPIVIKEGTDSNSSSGTTDDAQNSFPNAPLLSIPDHQAISLGLRPKFEWSTVDGADYYIIHVSRLSPAGGMTLDVIKDEATEPTFTPKVSLEPHILYYWQVKPIKDNEEGKWSEQWEFSLIEPMAQKSVSFQSNEEQPVVTSLDQNYPNPFNPTTRIEFALSETQKVSLHVYDMSGRQVAMLVDDVLQAGYHSATFDASQLASGIYIYRFISDSQQFSRKMTLIK